MRTPLLALSALISLAFAALPAWSQVQGGQPGVFDYYVLTLSWSPEYCHSNPTDAQCSKHLGFVVHGLWPEFKKGGYPENCSKQLGLSDPSTMLDIMPDLGLIQHEWTTHGTCSGLSADDYFALIRKAYNSTHIPSQLTAPSTQITMSPSQIKQAFQQANGGLATGDVLISCTSYYLKAVEVCYSKSLSAIPCTQSQGDCHVRSIKVPPV